MALVVTCICITGIMEFSFKNTLSIQCLNPNNLGHVFKCLLNIICWYKYKFRCTYNLTVYSFLYSINIK